MRRVGREESTMTGMTAADRIAAYCQAQAGAMRATLERIVNIDSSLPNPAGVQAVGEVLGAELGAAGFVTTRLPPAAAVEPWVAEFFLGVEDSAAHPALADHLLTRKAAVGEG